MTVNAAQWMQTVQKSEQAFRSWQRTSARIVDRYNLERERTASREGITSYSGAGVLNILWSNIETQRPAIFSRSPKITAERRFKDRDPIGRVAAQVLERAVNEEAEQAGMRQTMNAVVLDVLLVGRGVPWVRYEEKPNGPVPLTDLGPNGLVDPQGRPVPPGTPGLEMGPKGPVLVQQGREQKLVVDYVHWRDFTHSLDRNWAEVQRTGWVARRIAMTEHEGVQRFGKKFAKVQLTLTTRAAETRGVEGHGETPMYEDTADANAKYASVYEIWDRKTKRRIHIADGFDEELEVADDPYHLEDFFPCPRPAYATLSNEDLRPTQDYLQYEGLANELDDLTTRIGSIVRVLKVVGGYDAALEGLAEMMNSRDGTMVGIQNFAKMMAAGGTLGAFQFWPVETAANVLQSLYLAREQTTQRLYEISGISDIVRGQVDPREKATQSQLKANFAGQRLEQRRRGVEYCARDVGRMLVEMMAEQYDPQVLRQKSGYDFIPEIVNVRENWRQAQQEAQAQYEQQLQASQQPPEPGPDGQPGQPVEPPMPPEPPPPDPTERIWGEVMRLIKDERMRGFRIDIETDSTIELDSGDEMQKRTEMLQAAGSFLSNVLPVVQMSPEMTGPVGELLLFTLRGMKTARPLEGKFEEAVEQLEQKTAQMQQEGPPPDPEKEAAAQKTQQEIALMQQKGQVEIQKGQLELQKTQADVQRAGVEAQAGQQKARTEIGAAAQLANIEAQKAQVEIAARNQELRHAEEKHRMEMELRRQEIKESGEAAVLDKKKAAADIKKSEAQAKNAKRMDSRPKNG